MRVGTILALLVATLAVPVAEAKRGATKQRTVQARPKHKVVRASKVRPGRPGARRNAGPAGRRSGCRDVFCNGVRVVAMGDQRQGQGLTFAQVERTMGRLQGRLQPCALQARRRDPGLREARIEFVVSPKGTVMATRVNGQRRSALARCIHGVLGRRARFAPWRYRQVAEFRLTLAN